MNVLNKPILLHESKHHIEDWMVKEDGSLILQEGVLAHEKSIKIQVNSNEFNGHHRPHVHAWYQDKEYVISIDNSIEVLSENEDRFSKMLVKMYFKRDEWMQIFRKGWNEKVQSLLILVEDSNGNITGDTVCRSK